jgi:hypothetical protein
MVRELLLLQDFNAYWSGVGPDGGKDLIFDEPGNELLGKKRRRWLVSCKDFSSSGRSVGVADLEPVVDTCAQHSADGYLLVCTTHPSSAATVRLDAIENASSGHPVTHIWDGVTLERLLTSPRGWALAQQFMPVSAESHGWKVFGTGYPNKWVAVHRGHYFHLSNRVGSTVDFQLPTLSARLAEIEAIDLPQGHRFRLRGVWLDDAKGGGYVWYIDYMCPHGQLPGDLDAVRASLGEDITWEDGQLHTFDFHVQSYDPYSDHFDIDHYDYYERLPSYV